MDRLWHVVQTQPAAERNVTDQIAGLAGIMPLCPLEKRTIKHARRQSIVLRPFYPGYIFAKFHIEIDDWESILELRGVQTILGIRKQTGIATRARALEHLRARPRPLAVRKDAMDFVLASMNAEGIITPVEPPKIQRLAKDTKVRVLEGPFTGFEGLVQYDRKKRVGVLLDLFGRSNVIPLPRESITPI